MSPFRRANSGLGAAKIVGLIVSFITIYFVIKNEQAKSKKKKEDDEQEAEKKAEENAKKKAAENARKEAESKDLKSSICRN
jgi:mannitol-specific phosphotransferase system IIBC component